MSMLEASPRWTEGHIGIFDWRNVFRSDRLTVVLVLVLAVVGLMNLYSTDYPLASTAMDAGGQARTQLRNLLFACAVAAVIVCFDYRFLLSLAPLAYLITIGLLIYVEVRGYVAGGSQRWIDLGFTRLQPSEIAKISLIYMLAWYLGLIGERIRKIPYLVLAFIIVGVPAVLIIMQPDLGTTLVLGPIALAMVWMAGCRLWHIASLGVLGVIAVGVIIAHVYGVVPYPESAPDLSDYQKTRIQSFFEPDADPTGAGWHAMQTRLAVGSGGMLGMGFRRGIQTHLKYVPEYKTDSIFVVLAEENGFVGGMILLGLFAALFSRGLILARDCPDMAGTLLGVGCVTMLFVHVFTNIAITIGLMPVTGLPLPFLSYGGTFYLTVMICIATILSLNMRKGVPGRPV